MATALTRGASAPRASTPTKNSARLLPGAEGRAKAHGASFDYIDDALDRKAFANARALAALAGVELLALPDGGYLVSRWNLSRELSDLQAVREWLARVGVHS